MRVCALTLIPAENTTKITMTEALFLITDSETRKQKEIQAMGGRGPQIGMMLSMNDEVIKKTKQYIDRFVQFDSVEVSKEMRRIAKQHGISTDLCIHIQDLGLREYDEAISLFPDLKEYPREHVEELIEIIKVHTN